MLELEAFILVGGASSRMGTDKAALELGGELFIERIANALAPVARSVKTVGAKQTIDRRLRNVPDVHPQWGALGGLHTALDVCKAEWAAVVACDLPFVTEELFNRLASFGEKVDAVIPVQTDGRVQPLCALYRREPCLEITSQLIAEGERRPRALLDKIKARRVKPDELADLKGAQLFFMNVNTPEDYEQAKKTVISDE